jgi:hypothetical protein
MQKQPELISGGLGARGAVGGEMGFPGLDVVLSLSAPAVEVLVEGTSAAVEAWDNGFIDHVDQPIEIAASFDLSRFDYRHPPRPSAAAGWDRVIASRFPRTKAG